MGKLSEWSYAEDQLKKALTDFCGKDWTIDEGDGAFYGPIMPFLSNITRLQQVHEN